MERDQQTSQELLNEEFQQKTHKKSCKLHKEPYNDNTFYPIEMWQAADLMVIDNGETHTLSIPELYAQKVSFKRSHSLTNTLS